MLKRLILALSDRLEKPFPEGSVVDGSYEVIKLLGSGGYGHTYLAIDMRSGKRVSLKALRLHKRLMNKGRQGFLREARLMADTEHNGLPAYFGSGNHKGIPFYTMEYIDGKTVEQLIFQDGKAFSEREVFAIAEKLLEIIGYLHQKGIIHRDIRIPNVMVKEDEVYLIDLGLATPSEPGKQRNITIPMLRKRKEPQADFYGLGHFLLFLFYSAFNAKDGQKEESWEEELQISTAAKRILRRLLQTDGEYVTYEEILQDIQQLTNREDKKDVIVQ